MSSEHKRRVIYNVIEYSPLCDSSDMTMDDWIRIAKDIKVRDLLNFNKSNRKNVFSYNLKVHAVK